MIQSSPLPSCVSPSLPSEDGVVMPSPPSPLWRARNRRGNSQQGFTLLEIMVVVVIIGIIAGMAVTKLNPTKPAIQAKETSTLVTLQRVKSAVQIYYLIHNGYPGMDELVKDGHLTATVKDAWGGPVHIKQEDGRVWAVTPEGKTLTAE